MFGYQELGVASGWNLCLVIRSWVWLKCIDVVYRGCCCKEVYSYIDVLILLISLLHLYYIYTFFCSSIPTSLFIFKMFFRSLV